MGIAVSAAGAVASVAAPVPGETGLLARLGLALVAVGDAPANNSDNERDEPMLPGV